ncbi:hypothetical protein FB45DRAFT_1007739 [Roridomyces roridus]|uniref:Cyanovirin-N domain-containing protein n=1 Tax=Roridomyces roridus TaxID=1738132 RepID=A0AAD7BC71_9AGAR|nr:hypothetical protein FB45DRAFT_1007739 [Roridomyces roridus]
MKFSTNLLAIVALASTAVLAALPQTTQSSASCQASERVHVQTRNFTTPTGDVLSVSTKACPAALANAGHNKRQVINACVAETINFACITNAGTAPAVGDCNTLNSAIISVFEAAGDPALFSVGPGLAEEFTLGTCAYVWNNENAAATLEFCFSEITQTLGPTLNNGCIAVGQSGGLALPVNSALPATTLDWVFEVIHS